MDSFKSVRVISSHFHMNTFLVYEYDVIFPFRASRPIYNRCIHLAIISIPQFFNKEYKITLFSAYMILRWSITICFNNQASLVVHANVFTVIHFSASSKLTSQNNAEGIVT